MSIIKSEIHKQYSTPILDDTIIFLWNKAINEYGFVPYISHGLTHHLNVVNNIIYIYDQIRNKKYIREDTFLSLLTAASIHDMYRSHNIVSNPNDTKNIYFFLQQINFENRDAILEFIKSHNNVNLVDSTEKALIFLADKMDYTFHRALLVQIFDKIINKSKTKNTTHLNISKILHESKEKMQKDIRDITFISRNFPNIPDNIFSKIIRKYEDNNNKAKNLIKVNKDIIANYKKIIKIFLIKDIKSELEKYTTLNLSCSKRIFLNNQIKMISYYNQVKAILFIIKLKFIK